MNKISNLFLIFLLHLTVFSLPQYALSEDQSFYEQRIHGVQNGHCDFYEDTGSTIVECRGGEFTTIIDKCVKGCHRNNTEGIEAHRSCTAIYNGKVSDCDSNEIGPGRRECDAIVKCQKGSEEQRKKYCIRNVQCAYRDVYCDLQDPKECKESVILPE